MAPVGPRKPGEQDGLAALVKNELHKDPFTGTVFVFRSRRADRLKLLYWVSRCRAVAIVARTNGATMATPRERRSGRHWFEKPLLERHWFKPNGGGARRKTGLVMAYKRLEEHTFTWPAIKDGVMNLGHAQFEALFSGLDWRRVRAVEVLAPLAVE